MLILIDITMLLMTFIEINLLKICSLALEAPSSSRPENQDNLMRINTKWVQFTNKKKHKLSSILMFEYARTIRESMDRYLVRPEPLKSHGNIGSNWSTHNVQFTNWNRIGASV